MKIYLASSWRNQYQAGVLAALRRAGHEVYDFKNPAPGNTALAGSSVIPSSLTTCPSREPRLVGVLRMRERKTS